ncbi:hypothetical protein T11_9736 [Trichinella zimbabwensis]|uniref:Uncharacterized protein n=1 Tax=Trichinella zimbabwensis TaxID=268475 RepID=A0A0V1I8H3_9BILA|nr:hypothetical protein T11_9736 [Trichinella zimbabwensis]
MTLLHYEADHDNGFHAISDDLDQFRELLQEVLSVKEQLNTVTVHLRPLNLLSKSFSCIVQQSFMITAFDYVDLITRLGKSTSASLWHTQRQLVLIIDCIGRSKNAVQQLQRIPGDIKNVDVQLEIMKVSFSTGEYLVEMTAQLHRTVNSTEQLHEDFE